MSSIPLIVSHFETSRPSRFFPPPKTLSPYNTTPKLQSHHTAPATTPPRPDPAPHHATISYTPSYTPTPHHPAPHSTLPLTPHLPPHPTTIPRATVPPPRHTSRHTSHPLATPSRHTGRVLLTHSQTRALSSIAFKSIFNPKKYAKLPKKLKFILLNSHFYEKILKNFAFNFIFWENFKDFSVFLGQKSPRFCI